MIAFVLTACLTDIRPSTIENLTDESGAAERGRARLEAAAKAHGGVEAWKSHTSVTVELTDTWQGFVARMVNPWPTAAAHVRLEQRLHSFDSRATFLDEEHKGLVWGIVDGRTWHTREGVTEATTNEDAAFILPTMHYFTELPYRLLEAPIILDAGPETIDGVTYPRVFVTWQSLDPTAEFDQYVVYIDPQTGRIAKTFYTVREVANFVKGTINFADYTEIDGSWLPMTMYVSPEPADGPDDNLHYIEVASWSFDDVDASAFVMPEAAP